MGASEKKDATFHPGQASVSWPEQVAAWGEPPPDDPDPAVDRLHYRSPGVPPWGSLHQDIGHPEPRQRKGLPAWAWVSIVLGGLFIVCSGLAVVALTGESGPVPAVTIPAGPAVTTTGTCEKKLVGDYGLVATVTATNTTSKAQTGQVWVQWPVTGEAALKFTKPVTLAPGEAVEFPVNQAIPAERWFRVGACSYGWAPA